MQKEFFKPEIKPSPRAEKWIMNCMALWSLSVAAATLSVPFSDTLMFTFGAIGVVPLTAAIGIGAVDTARMIYQKTKTRE